MIRLALVLCLACSSPSSEPVGSGSGSGSAPSAERPPPKIEYDLCHGPWCWVSGRPQGNKLHDVVAVGNQVWAVGEWGTVLHH
ncbi:MAG: hypothetical protein H0V17_16510, partial [Deltaproteobacteria bacterium]|nr:hypothetical protein [Deltaproteobacteria bacterium]